MGAALISAVVFALVAAPVVAQDDWSITRDRDSTRGGVSKRRGDGQAQTSLRRSVPATAPDDPSAVLLHRYEAVLARDPFDVFALERLVVLLRDRGGGVAAWLTALGNHPDGDSPKVRALEARVMARLGEVPRAVETLARLEPSFVGSGAYWRVRASLEREGGMLEAAAASLERAVSVARGSARAAALRERGELEIAMGRFDDAERVFATLARLGGGTSDREAFAAALSSAGEHGRAADEYERLLAGVPKISPWATTLVLARARAELEDGRPLDAAAGLRAAWERGQIAADRRAEAGVLLVECHERGGAAGEALPFVERVSPESVRAELTARIFEATGQVEDALAVYARAARLWPRSVDWHEKYVAALLRTGQIDAAVEAHRLFLARAPATPGLLREATRLLVDLGRRDEAIELVERTVARASGNVRTRKEAAEIYARLGANEAYAAEVEALFRRAPTDVDVAAATAAIRLSNHDEAGARRAFERIGDADRDPVERHRTIAQLLMDHDRVGEAIPELETALRMEPRAARTRAMLANAFERLGREEEAERAWSAVLSEAGTDIELADEARRRIVTLWIRQKQVASMESVLRARVFGNTAEVDAARLLVEVYLGVRPPELRLADATLERLNARLGGDRATLLRLVDVRRARKDTNGILAALSALLQVDPDRASKYYQQMSHEALSAYRDEDALRFATLAVERDPGDASAHESFARLLERQHDLTRASAEYVSAYRASPTNFASALRAADLLSTQGDGARGLAIYLEVIRRANDDATLAQATTAATHLAVATGAVDALEEALLRRAAGSGARPTLRHALLELYKLETASLPLDSAAPGAFDGAEPAVDARIRALAKRAATPLLETLHAGDAEERRLAMRILGRGGVKSAEGPLLALASDDSMPLSDRADALLMAARLARQGSFDAYAKLVRSGLPVLRPIAVWGAMRTGDRRAPALLRTWMTDVDPLTRSVALLCWADLVGSRARGALPEFVGQDEVSLVRVAAIHAYARIAPPSELENVAVHASADDPAVAEAATVALAARGIRVDGLYDGLFELREERRAVAAHAAWVESIVRTRAENDPDRPLPATVNLEHVMTQTFAGAAARDGNYGWRFVAALARRAPRVVDAATLDLEPTLLLVAIRRALSGPPNQVALALGLLRRGVREAEGRDAARGPSPFVEAAIAVAPVLERIAADPRRPFRVDALAILHGVHAPHSAELLADALEDGSVVTVRGVLDELSRDEREVPPALIERSLVEVAERHANWMLRRAALEILARAPMSLSARRSVLGIAENDPYAFVREAAVLAVRRSLDDGARAVLERVATVDAEPRIREAARTILALPAP
ncbi:MAG: hypothetical protein KC417_14955 [Myxococcales bacterium]|nr:hypothetical protein [Myxococcales bacterium]